MVAYADDVTIFVTSPADIQLIQEALTCYQAASEARLNIEKSKAMAIGSWDISTDIMGIQYHTDINIMGVRMHNTVSQSVNNSRTAVTGKIRAQARDAFNRDLCLDQRVQYTHNYLLAKAWYTAQIFPPPEACVRHLNTAIAWYIRHGEIFKVPLVNITKTKRTRRMWLYTRCRQKPRSILIPS